MNKLKAVVDRLVRETGLSRTVSRRIANKINRLAGRVNWATPVQGAQADSAAASARSGPKATVPAALRPGDRIILPNIPASKPVVKGRAASPRFRPR